MKNINDIIAENIKKIRVNKNITQKELSKMIGISSNTLIKIENKNEDYNPSIKVIDRIANALGVTLNDLITDIEIKDSENNFSKEDTEEKANEIYEKYHKKKIERTYYPPIYETNKNVESLLEFIVYLPILSPIDIYTILSKRVENDIVNNEVYISNLIDSMIASSKNTLAKKYADILCREIKMIRKGITPEKHPELFIHSSIDLINKYKDLESAYIYEINKKNKFFTSLRNLMLDFNE